MKIIPTIKIECQTEEKYNQIKEDKDFSQGKSFDDKNKTIIYANGDIKDYTKDINGKELNLNYSEYELSLNKIGYTCKLK